MTPLERLRQRDRLKTISRCPSCGAWVSWRHQPAARRRAATDPTTCQHQPAQPHRLDEQQSNKGRARQLEIAREVREAKFEDARWLIESGVHATEIARRLDTTVDALSRLARRWGADDIAAYCERERQRGRAA